MTSKTIHYIDDDSDDLECFSFAVKQLKENITLHTHKNVDHFLETLKPTPGEQPIIFLDINMPVKTGFDVLKEIRQCEHLKNLPVVMYSTSSDPVSISISRDLGADLYAVKPSGIKEIESLIHRVIGIQWGNFSAGQKDFVIRN